MCLIKENAFEVLKKRVNEVFFKVLSKYLKCFAKELYDCEKKVYATEN